MTTPEAPKYFVAHAFAPPGLSGMEWEVGETGTRSRVCMCTSEENARRVADALNSHTGSVLIDTKWAPYKRHVDETGKPWVVRKWLPNIGRFTDLITMSTCVTRRFRTEQAAQKAADAENKKCR